LYDVLVLDVCASFLANVYLSILGLKCEFRLANGCAGHIRRTSRAPSRPVVWGGSDGTRGGGQLGCWIGQAGSVIDHTAAAAQRLPVSGRPLELQGWHGWSAGGGPARARRTVQDRSVTAGDARRLSASARACRADGASAPLCTRRSSEYPPPPPLLTVDRVRESISLLILSLTEIR
jgi:hypothetical protein